jgi:hypothetical protein
MKLEIKTILLLVFFAGVGVLLGGCGKQPVQLDQGWSSPVKIADSQEGTSGSGNLYKWHDTLILMNERQEWLPHSSICSSSICSMLIRKNDPSNSWTQLPPIRVPGYYAFYCPAFDQASDRIMFEGGSVESNQLHMSAIFVRMTASRGIQVEAERKSMVDKKSLFGETGPNVTLNNPYYGAGVIGSSDVYIPYCLDCTTVTTCSEHKPFNNGVFHSADSGSTWQMEQISDSEAFDPSVCKTKDCYYYFANGRMGMEFGSALWFSRKPVGDGSWDTPQAVSKTVPFGVEERYVAATEGDMVHLCWLDRRHEKKRLDFLYRYRGNYEIAYRQRKDSDADWSRDVILSQSVFYSFSPSMSVDGDKIVIAWSGNQSTDDHWHMTPNDIYYVTSKDGGKTWAKPLKVTDSAKDGIRTSGPQVAVQDGVIHLFYVQGKEDRHLSRQAPWPVYYQQRPFPN